MRIWILQTGEPVPTDKSGFRPMRAMNLLSALSHLGHEITLWTSDFDHFTKSHRGLTGGQIALTNTVKIKFIPSMGYKSHFGLRRFLDHSQLGLSSIRMLRGQQSPDVAFIGYPPIESAWVFSRWLKKRKVPFLVDIKDVWPDLIVTSFPRQFQKFLRILLSPHFLMMKSTFARANGIVSISQDFLEWGLENANRSQGLLDCVAPLTSPDIEFTPEELLSAKAFWDSHGVLENEIPTVYFVGTLSANFNFEPVLRAASKSNIQFVIAGDGPERLKLLKSATRFKNVVVPGWISSSQAFILAQRASIAIGPTIDRHDFEMSMPNKFIDAFRLGKPMLTSNQGVVSELLIENNAGRVYTNSIPDSFLIELQEMISDNDLLQKMGTSARQLYDEQFSFDKIYTNLVGLLESTIKSGMRTDKGDK